MPHICGYGRFGTYKWAVALVAPPFMADRKPFGVTVDACLALEVSDLWKKGIETTGCCCGHKHRLPYIGVIPEHIERMKALGYEVVSNPHDLSREDSFKPKTDLS